MLPKKPIGLSTGGGPGGGPGGGGGFNNAPGKGAKFSAKNWHQRWNASKDVIAKRMLRLRSHRADGGGPQGARLNAVSTLVSGRGTPLAMNHALAGLGQGLGRLGAATVATVARRVAEVPVADAAAVAATMCLPGTLQAVQRGTSAEVALASKAALALQRFDLLEHGFVVSGPRTAAAAATVVRPRGKLDIPSNAVLSREALERNLLHSPTKVKADSPPLWEGGAPAAAPVARTGSRFSDWELEELAVPTSGEVPWPLPCDAAAPAGAFLDEQVSSTVARVVVPAAPPAAAPAASPVAPPPRRAPAPAGMVPVYNWAKLEMGEKIGAGSFGAVSRARLHGSKVEVAVKVPLDATDTSLLREARLLSALRHPNLVRVFGVCRNPPALVSELAPRGALSAQLEKRRGKPLPMDVAHKVLAGIAEGCRFLHAQTPPVVHRDLSANNVLLSTSWRPLLADFGLSKARVTSRISNGGGTGTPNYMAPEVLQAGKVTEKADVYSFGVLLWEIITGQVPWAGHNAFQIIYQVCCIGNRLEIPEGIHPGLKALMQHCWDDEPTGRPGFDQICAALDECFRPPSAAPLLQAA